MTAASRKSAARKLPLKLGLFHVTGAILEGQRRTDLLDVTSGPGGDLGVVILDLRAVGSAETEVDKLARSLAGLAAQGFRERTPLHAIMLDLARGLLGAPTSELGVTLIRGSAADARVEVATAGMPPVACVHPDRRVTLHAVAAPPLTSLSGGPPPIEVVPLTWGCTWLAISDGFSPSADQAAVVQLLAQELELADEGAALSQLPPHALRGLLEARALAHNRLSRDDASLLLISANLSARSRSGIQRSRS